MAKEIETNYTFNASGKTVTFTSRTSVRNDYLYAIINVTRGAIYYAAGDSTKTITITNNTVTLNAGVSTSGHADTDALLIIYEDLVMLETIEALRMTIHSLTRTMGMANVDGTGQTRVVMSTIPNMSTLTTCSTVTNQSQYGTYACNDVVPSLMRIAADNLRNNITII